MIILKALLLKYRIHLIVSFFLASMASSAYFTAQYKDGQYAKREQRINEVYLKELEQRHQEYAQRLSELNQQALKKQTDLAKINSRLERQYHEANKNKQRALDRYLNLVRHGVRLPDAPEADDCAVQLPNTPEGGASRATHCGDGTARGGKLPATTARALGHLAADADRVVEQLRVSQEYAKLLRDICSK